MNKFGIIMLVVVVAVVLIIALFGGAIGYGLFFSASGYKGM